MLPKPLSFLLGVFSSCRRYKELILNNWVYRYHLEQFALLSIDLR